MCVRVYMYIRSFDFYFENSAKHLLPYRTQGLQEVARVGRSALVGGYALILKKAGHWVLLRGT